VAANAFWVSYSAYVRHIPRAEADKLLELLSQENGQNWSKSIQHTHVWHEKLDRVVEWYVEKVKEYAEKYLESPAGKKMRAAVVRARRYSKALPTVDTDTLRSFDDAEGISWGMAEVCDIFYILSEATQFEDMTVEIHKKPFD